VISAPPNDSLHRSAGSRFLNLISRCESFLYSPRPLNSDIGWLSKPDDHAFDVYCFKNSVCLSAFSLSGCLSSSWPAARRDCTLHH